MILISNDFWHKIKMIILTHTMYCCLLLQMLLMTLCSRDTYSVIFLKSSVLFASRFNEALKHRLSDYVRHDWLICAVTSSKDEPNQNMCE